MKKMLLTGAGVLVCVGCEGLRMYEMITDAVINTAAIGGVVAGAFALPDIVQFIQDLLAGL